MCLPRHLSWILFVIFCNVFYVFGQNGDYLILTTSTIYDPLNNASVKAQIDAFKAHKQNRGFNVEIITENTWGGGTGDVGATKIRNWLKNNTYDEKYILIIGGPDVYNGVPQSCLVPMVNSRSGRGLGLPGLSTITPTDFYYAELTGDWDPEPTNDNLFGEYQKDYLKAGCDHFAEVAVGRIPYYNDPTTLISILQKTINYENAQGQGEDISWRKNCILPMKPMYAGMYSWSLGEAIKNNLPLGWNHYRLYDKYYNGVATNAPTFDMECNEENVFTKWRYNPFGLAIWQTHGWNDGTRAEYVLSNGKPAFLDNLKPSFTFQASCWNAWPNAQQSSLAYCLLKNGAIATIASTNALVSDIISDEEIPVAYVSPLRDSPGNMAYFFSKFFVKGNVPVGVALNHMKSLLPIGMNGWLNCTALNLYGDPSVSLGFTSTSKAPSDLIATAISSTEVKLNWIDNADNEQFFCMDWRLKGNTAWVNDR